MSDDSGTPGPAREDLTVAALIAENFHATYETLAPEHGYETREASAGAWGDVPESNRSLMVATVQGMLDMGVIEPGPLGRHILARAWPGAVPGGQLVVPAGGGSRRGLTGIPLGHYISSHVVLGWCCLCRDRSVDDELIAWQVWAMTGVPDVVEALSRR